LHSPNSHRGEPARREGCVMRRVPNVGMAQKRLDQPCVRAFVGQHVSGSMAQHVRMRVTNSVTFASCGWL